MENLNFNFNNDVEHFKGNYPFRKRGRVARSQSTANATAVATAQIVHLGASATTKEVIVETLIDTTPDCETEKTCGKLRSP